MILGLLVVAVVSGFASLKIAEAKGLNGIWYFFLGLFLPIVGILVAGFMPPAESSQGPVVGDPTYALAALRDPSDPQARGLLNVHRPELTGALQRCAAGEHVLAFGTGAWMKRPVVYLLTDGRLVLVAEQGRKITLVTDLDRMHVDEGEGEVEFPEGTLRPHANSPFTAHELHARIRHRQDFEPYVEVIAPGKLARPKPSKVDESVATPAQRTTDTVDELERLDALHQSGAIDDDEFAELKHRAMWGDDSPTESSG